MTSEIIKIKAKYFLIPGCVLYFIRLGYKIKLGILKIIQLVYCKNEKSCLGW